ncbi:MAG: hypothetical protein K0R34_3303 [Herbinix sp.]|jgi:hypothetical protein|nr:hypothetical protein [Herbinix sp.]
MEQLNKREIREQYKNRTLTGGVFRIKCSGSGHVWIKSTNDLDGQINKFNFFVSTNSCPEPTMRSDWNQYGAETFSFDILEKLEKGETQSDKEFADDIRALYEICLENSPQL